MVNIIKESIVNSETAEWWVERWKCRIVVSTVLAHTFPLVCHSQARCSFGGIARQNFTPH